MFTEISNPIGGNGDEEEPSEVFKKVTFLGGKVVQSMDGAGGEDVPEEVCYARWWHCVGPVVGTRGNEAQ